MPSLFPTVWDSASSGECYGCRKWRGQVLSPSNLIIRTIDAIGIIDEEASGLFGCRFFFCRAPPIADSSSAFVKRWGVLPELSRLWFACTAMSDEQTRPGNEPRPSTHGVNPSVPFGLESHLGSVRHE